jgi:surfactin synthase thioesterase subunit
MRLMIPVMRADLEMLASYQYCQPQAPLGVPTRLYFGTDDEPDPELLRKEWEAAVCGPVTAREFPGDHFFLHSAHDAVIRTLTDDIARAMTAD